MAVTILALRGVGLCLACPGTPRREFGGLTRAFLGVKQGGVKVNGGRGGVLGSVFFHARTCAVQCFFGH